MEEDPDDFTFDNDSGQATCPRRDHCPVRPIRHGGLQRPCESWADGQDRPCRRSSCDGRKSHPGRLNHPEKATFAASRCMLPERYIKKRSKRVPDRQAATWS